MTIFPFDYKDTYVFSINQTVHAQTVEKNDNIQFHYNHQIECKCFKWSKRL